MQEGKVIDLDSSLAIEASDRSVKSGLKLADSIIYATALRYNAILWTCV